MMLVSCSSSLVRRSQVVCTPATSTRPNGLRRCGGSSRSTRRLRINQNILSLTRVCVAYLLMLIVSFYPASLPRVSPVARLATALSTCRLDTCVRTTSMAPHHCSRRDPMEVLATTSGRTKRRFRSTPALSEADRIVVQEGDHPSVARCGMSYSAFRLHLRPIMIAHFSTHW